MNYLQPEIDKMKKEILEGIETAREIIPMTDEQVTQSLYKQYLQVAGYVNGLRNCDIEDSHRIKVMAHRAALRELGMNLL